MASQVTYSYTPVCVRGEGVTGDGFYGCGEQLGCGEDGRMFTVWAHLPDGRSEDRGEFCAERGVVVPARQVTAAVVLEAFRRVSLPASQVVVQPPGGETLVNLDTVFSTRAEGFTRTLGLLGHRVELEIWPSGFCWVAGDGTEQVTDWPGRTWARHVAMRELITHRYPDAGVTVQPRVDTTWSARFRVNGGAWQDVGGTVTIVGEGFDLRVLEASPALVG